MAAIPSWAEMSERVRLQIMPAGYLETAPLIHRTLSSNACVGCVLEGEQAYSYLGPQSLEHWGISQAEAFRAAYRNHDRAAHGTPVRVGDGTNRFAAIETGDSFDASRLLVSHVRRTIGNELGYPYYAGIPTRDLLICWAADCTREFDAFVRDRIRRDFETEAYALTPEVFVVDRDGLSVQR
jgi:hypothetical protein